MIDSDNESVGYESGDERTNYQILYDTGSIITDFLTSFGDFPEEVKKIYPSKNYEEYSSRHKELFSEMKDYEEYVIFVRTQYYDSQALRPIVKNLEMDVYNLADKIFKFIRRYDTEKKIQPTDIKIW